VPDDDGGAAWRLPRLPVFLSPYLYGLLAALMIVAMGNLTTAFAIHTDNTDEGNGWRFCFMCQTPQSYNWFAPSRIIQDYRTVSVAGGPPTKEKVGFETINEFPAFSFLLGDLHPHVLALPLVLLALAFGVALARRRPRPGSGWHDALPDGLDGWLGIAVVAVSAGALYTANTWDYPTYLLILLGCLGLPYLAARRRTDPAGGWRWARPWLVQAALLVVLSLVVFLPFHLTFVSLVGGDPAQIPPNLAQIPVLGGLLQKIGALLLVNTADKTILGFLVIFGIFLLGIVAWVAFEAIRYGRTRAQRAGAPTNLFAVWGGGLLAVLVVAWVLQFPLLALLLPLGVAALYLIWQQPARPERNTVLLLVAVGAFLGLAIEVFFLRDNFQMRMNTLFKFYFQIWVLWGLAAAYAVWRTLHTVFREPHAATAPGQISGTRALSVAWAGVFVLLVASGLLYSVYGPLARQVGGQAAPRGLDGMAWLGAAAPGDYAAIVWLKDHATSSDVVLEAGSDEYNRPGRVSAYTGVPTLVAWDNSHESLWRTGQPALRAQIQERRQVVNAIYQGRDPQNSQPLTAQRLLDLLHQYGVDYVFAGATERGVPGFAPSKPEEQMTPYAEGLFQQALPVAFHSGNTVVYAVREAIAGTGIAPAPPGTTPAPGAQATVDAGTPPVGLFDAGGPGAGRGQFTLPRGIARDAQGNFYVADTQNLRVEKFDPAGTFLMLFGGSGTGPGQFAPLRPDAEGTGPGGVAADAAGNVYVADTWNHRIQKFDATGKFLLQWGSFVDLGDPNGTNADKAQQGFYGPRGVAVGPDGNLYVTDTGNKRVVIFDANGGYQREISSGVSPTRKAPDYPFTQPGELNEPIGIAVDSAGNVYVADTNNRRIQKFTATGAPAAQWPVPAGSWEPGPYLEPFLAVDGAGNLYATAPTSHSVLKFSPTGTLLGQKSAQGDATLQLPTGLTVDAQGTVYVVDTTASRVVNLGTIP
jgi:YYY domain-containing protein